MAAVFNRKSGWLPVAAAAGVFAFLLIRPAAIISLRNRMERQDPAAWEKLPTNGRFALLLPQLISARYHDETMYAASVRQVLTRGRPYAAYWPEKRGLADWVQNSLGLYALAGVAAACGGNMTAAWCLSVALIGAAWFLLFFRAFSWWSGKKSVAYPLALFSVLFPDFYVWLLDINFHPQVNWERYLGVFFQYHAEIRPNFYRLPSLFLSTLLLCCLFLGLWSLACQKSKRPLLAALLGLGFGLMAWVHPFEFVFGMATLLLMTIVSERRENLVPAFLVALPVGALCSAAISLSVGRETWKEHLALLDVVYSHRFYLITLVHLIFAAFGWRLSRKEADPRRRTAWILLSCAQVAIFLCRNLQVVAGFSVMPFHYIPLGSFMGCLMLFLFAADALARRSWWRPSVALGVSLLLVGWGLANELVAARRTYPLFGLPRNMEAALDWTDANLPPGSTVLSLSMATSLALPVYTRSFGYASSLVLFTNPFTLQEYLLKMARRVKTAQADPDRFLAERWALPSARGQLLNDEIIGQRARSEVNPERVERLEWFASFLPAFKDDAAVALYRRQFRGMIDQAEPLSPPYYLWVGAGDARFLVRPPEEFGGERVYRNDGVSIYRFPLKPIAARLPAGSATGQ